MPFLSDLPPALQLVWWTALGLIVGSFLNVVIHRLPLEGESVMRPLFSRCPACHARLSWVDNLPILSYVLLRGRCRSCAARIAWRYPLVEAVTGAAFLVVAWVHLNEPRGPAVLLVHLLVVSALVVATFVDFERFEIPDEISIGGMVVAPLVSFLVPALHEHTWVAQWLTTGWRPGEPVGRAAALVASLAGMAAGAGVLWAIGRIGTAVFRREAMGFGDVKLLGAGGGFVGPGGAMVAFLLGAVVASVAGVANMARFFALSYGRSLRRGRRKPIPVSARTARECGRYLPFGPYLGIGIGIVLVAWNHVRGVID